MDENKKANLPDEPANSSIEPIAGKPPYENGEKHEPADISPIERGEDELGPANQYEKLEAAPESPVERAKRDVEKPGAGGFKEKVWRPYLWPVVTLVAICLVLSLALAVTNSITAPIIEQNAALAAEETRRELLPEASSFTDRTPNPLPSGITSMYEADNGTGYVIEAYGSGYGGRVPVMVAFDVNGAIAGVKFLDNDETPGLGKRLITDGSFAAQFKGLGGERVNNTDVDRIANATVSSNAAISAVNAALELYNSEVGGGSAGELTTEEIHALLLPDAGEIRQISITAENVSEAYAGDDGGFIIYGVAKGIYGDPVVAAVGIGADGAITGVWLDTSMETPGYGKELDRDTAFMEQFVGGTGTDGVDVVADATISSNAAIQAVQSALDALAQAKEAA